MIVIIHRFLKPVENPSSERLALSGGSDWNIHSRQINTAAGHKSECSSTLILLRSRYLNVLLLI